jgi:hypothetical protein
MLLRVRYHLGVTPPPSPDGWPDGPSSEGPFLFAVAPGSP